MSLSHSQQWDPEQYATNARFVSDLGMPAVDLLAPQPGETILDLGCGDGLLTMKLVDVGCHVVGIDSSSEMIDAAQSLGLNVQVMDARSLSFNQEFDAVFSNAALHWMKNLEEVITGVWRALKPGGRFAGEFGGYGNIATIVTAIESTLSARGVSIACPWFFPRPEEYGDLLRAAGFLVRSIAVFPRPTPLPGNVGGWLETFAQPYLSALPSAQRETFISELVEALRPSLCDAHGKWIADYVRLRFFAIKPNAAA